MINNHEIKVRYQAYTHNHRYDIIYDIERSQGNYLFDRVRDRLLLDCTSFFASNPIGYNHPKMNDSEFESKLYRVAKTKPASGDFMTEEMASFLGTFARVAMPKGMHKVFFISDGTLAVENGLKTAFDWKMRTNLDQDITGIKTEDLQVVHFERSFHGRSGYCMSLTNTDPVKYKLFPKFPWPRFRVPTDKVDGQIVADDIEDYMKRNRGKVAAIVLEPIQAEGGDRHFPEGFHKHLRKICDEQSALLIHDEVQTGVGLTGTMWAHEHFGILPDVLCFGKKLQVSGIMVGDRVLSVKNNVFDEPSRIDSTWGGNLTDMVRAERYLQIIEEDKLLRNAGKVGHYLYDSLKHLQTKFYKLGLMKNVRGLGLMVAFDLPSTQVRNKLLIDARDRGLLLLGCGDKSIRLRPPLTFTTADVDTLVQGLESLLADMAD